MLDRQCAKNEIIKNKKIQPTFPFKNYAEACKQADQRQRVKENDKGNNPSTALPRFFDFLNSLSSTTQSPPSR